LGRKEGKDGRYLMGASHTRRASECHGLKSRQFRTTSENQPRPGSKSSTTVSTASQRRRRTGKSLGNKITRGGEKRASNPQGSVAATEVRLCTLVKIRDVKSTINTRGKSKRKKFRKRKTRIRGGQKTTVEFECTQKERALTRS